MIADWGRVSTLPQSPLVSEGGSRTHKAGLKPALQVIAAGFLGGAAAG